MPWEDVSALIFAFFAIIGFLVHYDRQKKKWQKMLSLRNLLSSMDQVFYVYYFDFDSKEQGFERLEGNFQYVLHGKTREELKTFKLEDLVHPEDMKFLDSMNEDCRENQSDFKFEFRLLNADEKYEWYKAEGTFQVNLSPDDHKRFRWFGMLDKIDDVRELWHQQMVTRSIVTALETTTEDLLDFYFFIDRSGNLTDFGNLKKAKSPISLNFFDMIVDAFDKEKLLRFLTGGSPKNRSDPENADAPKVGLFNMALILPGRLKELYKLYVVHVEKEEKFLIGITINEGKKSDDIGTADSATIGGDYGLIEIPMECDSESLVGYIYAFLKTSTDPSAQSDFKEAFHAQDVEEMFSVFKHLNPLQISPEESLLKRDIPDKMLHHVIIRFSAFCIHQFGSNLTSKIKHSLIDGSFLLLEILPEKDSKYFNTLFLLTSSILSQFDPHTYKQVNSFYEASLAAFKTHSHANNIPSEYRSSPYAMERATLYFMRGSFESKTKKAPNIVKHWFSMAASYAPCDEYGGIQLRANALYNLATFSKRDFKVIEVLREHVTDVGADVEFDSKITEILTCNFRD
jgi:PAS fold